MTDGLDDRNSMPPALAGEDYYLEGANLVFTAAYHLKRGYCCGSGCRHCPYRAQSQPASASHQSPEPEEPEEG